MTASLGKIVSVSSRRGQWGSRLTPSHKYCYFYQGIIKNKHLFCQDLSKKVTP
jgi:hypothetical protein